MFISFFKLIFCLVGIASSPFMAISISGPGEAHATVLAVVELDSKMCSHMILNVAQLVALFLAVEARVRLYISAVHS